MLHRLWEEFATKVGRRYAGCRLATFVAETDAQRKAIRALTEFCETIGDRAKSGAGLILFGPVGTGKDHLAVGCLAEAVKAGLSVGFTEGQSLFAGFRDLIDSQRTEAQGVRDFTSPDVLLISDPLPMEGTNTDFQRSVLWRIVDRRYRDLKSTWVTMNVADAKEAERRLGAAIVDRLRDGALAVRCNWPSYRKAVEV